MRLSWNGFPQALIDRGIVFSVNPEIFERAESKFRETGGGQNRLFLFFARHIPLDTHRNGLHTFSMSKLALLVALAVLAACATFTRSRTPASTEIPYPSEPVPTGCQNLDALKSKPIALSGKLLLTYLPDGRHYNKLSDPAAPDYWELGLLDFDKPGSPIQRLTNDLVHDAEVRVSPDGKQIVWSKRPALDLFDGENEILVANIDMTGIRTIAHGRDTYYGIPSWVKPAGDKVMYSKQGDGDKVSKLLITDLKTGKTTALKTSFKGPINDPQMSRDGKKIVFKSGSKDDEDVVHLFIMNSDGSNVKQLTKHGKYRDEDPAFSPDGTKVAFERMYGGSKHRGTLSKDWYFRESVVIMDLATGKETAADIDECGKNELWLPTWSPDGELVMFTRGLHMENGDFVHDLWVMRKDGTDLQRVPKSDGAMFIDWTK